MKWVLISLILILLIHYLYFFLKNTLTVPKVRDLIYKPQMQYNELLKYSNVEEKEGEGEKDDDKKYLEEDEMSAELKKYVEELNN